MRHVWPTGQQPLRIASHAQGQTTKRWLEEHGISDKQYYYWFRKVRQNAFAAMSQNLPASQAKQLPAPALVEIPAESILPTDYVDENVSDKVVKIIQSYTGVVNKMVWRKW